MSKRRNVVALREWRSVCVRRAFSSPLQQDNLIEALSSSPNELQQMLSMALEALLPHVNLKQFSLLTRSCKALRFLTANIRWLYYCLQHLPPCNAVQTRSVFVLPVRSELQLHNVQRARYMQHSAFQNALVHHGSLLKLRAAYARRNRLRATRETRAQKYEARLRGLREALVADGLPPSIMWTTTIGLHFRYQCQWFPDSLFPTLLRQVTYKLQKHWYLTRHTDFLERLREHVALFGEYVGAYNNVSEFYTLPERWPWHQQETSNHNSATSYGHT
jgi:hypothetical protein